MKRTALIVSVLALAVGCRNKNVPEPGTDTSPAEPAATKGAPAEKKPTKPSRPEKKTLPAPKDVAAPPADAGKSESGLAWTVLKKGTGDKKPTVKDKVSVHYSGWNKEGQMFDSSVTRGAPASFRVTGVIKGWTEVLQLMTVGEKRRVWIPANLAYGDHARNPMTKGQLTFDVELLEIIEPPTPPEVPKDVAAPPATAKKTASGLSYVELKAGTGKSPEATSNVQVHYSGWNKEGDMFDSSIMRGQPATFRLNQVIKGWTEGLQLMKEGAKYRFWIPADLAYGERARNPKTKGQLTFDVELLKVL